MPISLTLTFPVSYSVPHNFSLKEELQGTQTGENPDLVDGFPLHSSETKPVSLGLVVELPRRNVTSVSN